MKILSNPLVRIFLSNIKPSSVTIETINMVGNMVGKMIPHSVASAAATTIQSQTDYDSVLSLLESESFKPLLEYVLVDETDTRLEGRVTQCPLCKNFFEIGTDAD